MDAGAGTQGMIRGREECLVQDLCRLDDLVDGEARGFEVAGLNRKVILVRRKEKVFAWRDACPHYPAGTPMAWKTDAYLTGDRSRLTCQLKVTDALDGLRVQMPEKQI